LSYIEAERKSLAQDYTQ